MYSNSTQLRCGKMDVMGKTRKEREDKLWIERGRDDAD